MYVNVLEIIFHLVEKYPHNEHARKNVEQNGGIHKHGHLIAKGKGQQEDAIFNHEVGDQVCHQVPVVDCDEEPHHDGGNGGCAIFHLLVRISLQFIAHDIGNRETTNDDHGRNENRIVSLDGPVMVPMNLVLGDPAQKQRDKDRFKDKRL